MKNGEKEEFVWLPLQTNYNKELLIAQFLRERQIEFYISMMYELQNSGTDTSHCEHVLVPAIHNLLFVHHIYDKNWCKRLMKESPYPIYFLKRERAGDDYCIVPEREMQNFMRATDPSIQGTRFIDPQKLKDKKVTTVRIIKNGPLYGITGKFLRYGGKHYIAIEVNGSAALLKVSYTWCEELISE